VKTFYRIQKLRTFSELFPFLSGSFLVTIGIVLSSCASPVARNRKNPKKIGIEAGVIGWESVFLNETYAALEEFVGRSVQVLPIVINREKSYSRQILPKLIRKKFSHFVFDVRTGSQSKLPGIAQSYLVLIICTLSGTTPLVILTDGSNRWHRYQASILTAKKGQIITFLEPDLMQPLFPHPRVVGPQIMPISSSTIDKYSSMAAISDDDFRQLLFYGSVYPRRSDFLQSLRNYLDRTDSGITLEVVAKSRNEPNVYWNQLAAQRVVITTTFQQYDGVTIFDRQDINQLVFRVSEGLAMGCLVFSMHVPGIEKHFKPGSHFVEFSTSEDLGNKLIYYSKNLQEANAIANDGHKIMRAYSKEGVFWKRALNL
jgi:hypothetical protein